MDCFDPHLMKIGIIGGGQLGKMMAQKAKKMGFYVMVLDPTPDSPAAQVADKQITGGFHDGVKLRGLVEECDVTTCDIEHVNTQVLKELSDEGYKIHPSPHVLELIQDKFRQKSVLAKAGIPVPRFMQIERLTPRILKKFGIPLVWKARRGGYDGRGVEVIRKKADLEKALKAGSFIEEFIDFKMELAVMVARNTLGEVQVYPVVETIFDERANICELVVAPARIEKEVQRRAQAVAIQTIEVLGAVGIFGVELFLTGDGTVLVNEVAPRPHNSGHYTIEACLTCQFEQHIRAVTGLPLGSTKLLSAAVMMNLLGDAASEGTPCIEGLARALSIPGLSFHYYGKKTTRPFRKMGHVTILNKSLERAIATAVEVKGFLKVGIVHHPTLG